MLIYEKDNKLNINFDNEVNENSDLQISKEDGKTQILIDGQESGGIPAIEAGDEGKVITATRNGAGWELPYYDVTLTPTNSTQGTFSGNFTDLTNAAQEGKFVRAYMMIDNTPVYLATTFLFLFESADTHYASSSVFINDGAAMAIVFNESGNYSLSV